MIGTTRSRSVCSAIRDGVKPALDAATTNDMIYTSMRKSVFNYVARDSEEARDLRIVQMDRQIADLVKSTKALEEATNSYTFKPAPSTSADETTLMKRLQGSLKGILSAQKIQLDAMSGFVETERSRRFGKLDEAQQQIAGSLSPTNKVGSSPSPVTGFLADSQHTLVSPHSTPVGLQGANLLDRDLGDIQNVTARREAIATKAIIDAAALCRGK